MLRSYNITIEVTDNEKTNLQRFLMEAHRLAILCFGSATTEIVKNGVSDGYFPNEISQGFWSI